MQRVTCSLCGVKKPQEDFYKSKKHTSGYENRCKECNCRSSRKRLANSYRTDPKERKRQHEAFLSRKAEGRHIITEKRMRIKYREKYIARYKFRNAVNAGKIAKLPCEVCGNPESQGHHEDYSKPFEVIWLCIVHHAQHHSLQRELSKHLTPALQEARSNIK